MAVSQLAGFQEIQIFKYTGLTGKAVEKTGAIKVQGGPAGIRTAE